MKVHATWSLCSFLQSLSGKNCGDLKLNFLGLLKSIKIYLSLLKSIKIYLGLSFWVYFWTIRSELDYNSFPCVIYIRVPLVD